MDRAGDLPRLERGACLGGGAIDGTAVVIDESLLRRRGCRAARLNEVPLGRISYTKRPGRERAPAKKP